MIPVYINCRDRVTPLKQMVEWLEKAGHERIVLIDNASSYEPLLDFYESTPHQVVRLRTNAGSRAIWDAELAPSNEWYVYSDPDIVPVDDCPLDLIAHLREWLERRPDFPKAGPGLYLEDLPKDFPHWGWETGPQIRGPILGQGAYASLIDTTFALYRPGARFAYEGIRMDFPYEARHISPSWYCDVPLSAEDRYYLEHARTDPCLGSSWAATV